MDFTELNRSRFVSLSTFRKTGVAVPTPVWVAKQGDDLLVTTPSGSGKLKRLRNNPAIEARSCSRMGKVVDNAPIVSGVATIEPETPEIIALFKKKYGFEYPFVLRMERLFGKGPHDRLIIRITPA